MVAISMNLVFLISSFDIISVTRVNTFSTNISWSSVFFLTPKRNSLRLSSSKLLIRFFVGIEPYLARSESPPHN